MDFKDIKGNYAFDQFLSKFENRTDLENLRKELKLFANELHTSMTDILKTETEAIVNLAEHLTNLNSKVSDLASPVFQLHEEIKSLYMVIKDAEISLQTYLNKAKYINQTRDNLNMQMNMKITSLCVNNILSKQLNEDINDLALLERAVNEFSFQNGYMNELYSGQIQKDNATIETEETFRSLVNEMFIKSLKYNMEKSIVCCLRTYVSLNQQDKAEIIYSEKIVEPVLSKIFTNKNLEHHDYNLKLLYDEALKFLNKDIKALVDLVNSNTGLKGFNFIVNSYWKVTDKLLQENLSHITAPGNPELFQKRFYDTWQFLSNIANQVDPSLIYDPTFQEHMKRFNLAVYFEIRFQQISTSFEADIVESETLQSLEVAGDNSFLKLKVSAAFWRSINHCFHSEVFLAHLSDQFIKLFLLLLSRYLHYIDNALKNSGEQCSETFIVNLVLDIDWLKKSLGVQKLRDIDKSIFKIVPNKLWIFIEKIIEHNEKSLNNTHEKLRNYLIDYKVRQSLVLLQQISAIPRLYRRTNRCTPTEESNYIREVVVPIELFYKNNEELLKDSIRNDMDTCINHIGEQYIALVEDVLHSVCKTEESLRRLKSRNVNTSDESSNPKPDLTSDEAKIREQIRLDVKYFVMHMKQFVSEKGQNTLESLIKLSGCSL